MNIISDLVPVKTGAWKEIQLSFHNFIVIENLGMKFTTEKSKDKKRFVIVQCILCGLKYTGTYALFKTRDKVCICESKKGKGSIKRYPEDRERKLKILNGMKDRCYKVKKYAYKNYGARGITICKEWLNDKENFVKWCDQSGYKNDLTLDRIDNDQGYSPENCRWITKSEQSRNKRNTLREDKVKIIKQMLNDNINKKEISRVFNVPQSRINSINLGLTWKNV